jgi:hypothetical protein
MTNDDLRSDLITKTDDELVAMVRDRESGEWRPEALVVAAAILTERGVPLPEAETPATDEAEFVELVTVAGFMNHVDAEACRSALEGAGFHAIARDANTLRADNLLAPMMGGVRVAVPRAEAEDAQAFLAAAESGALATAVPCPSCGSSDTAAETRTAASETVSERVASALGMSDDEETWFRCRACGHEWQ